MGLVYCPECGTKISDKASVCPFCGYRSSTKNMPMIASNSPLKKIQLESTSLVRCGFIVSIYHSKGPD